MRKGRAADRGGRRVWMAPATDLHHPRVRVRSTVVAAMGPSPAGAPPSALRAGCPGRWPALILPAPQPAGRPTAAASPPPPPSGQRGPPSLRGRFCRWEGSWEDDKGRSTRTLVAAPLASLWGGLRWWRWRPIYSLVPGGGAAHPHTPTPFRVATGGQAGGILLPWVRTSIWEEGG